MSNAMVYGGINRTPGVSAVTTNLENEFLWGNFEAQFVSGYLIDGSSTDSGNTGYTSILRSGLLLGKVHSTEKLKPWSPDAHDGSEYIWGVLGESVSLLMNNVATDRLMGKVYVSGGLLSSRIIVPGTTAFGISGNALEYLVRQQLQGRFVLNDSYQYARPDWQIHTTTNAEETAGITLLARDSHREYQADGAITITLPANPYKGLAYRFTSLDGAITVSSGSSNIKVPGAAAANSLTVDDVAVELRGNGSVWVVYELSDT